MDSATLSLTTGTTERNGGLDVAGGVHVHMAMFEFDRRLDSEIHAKWTQLILQVRVKSAGHSAIDMMDGLSEAMEYLKTVVDTFRPELQKESSELISSLRLSIKAILFAYIPPDLSETLGQICQAAFNAITYSQRSGHDIELDCEKTCGGCDKEWELCECEKIKTHFGRLLALMDYLDLSDRLISDPALSIAYRALTRHVDQVSSGSFDVERLEALTEWVEDFVVGWMEVVFEKSETHQRSRQKERLLFHLHHAYGSALIRQLFDILVDFPDSTPAINDLKRCLNIVPLRHRLLTSLNASVTQRLLHSGVNTSEILLLYIQAVKSLRMLDPSGTIMEIVCELIRLYLRQRSDTVRCIVSFLTEQRHPELNADLMRGAGEGEMEEGVEEEMGVDNNWRQWQPDPIDATALGRRSRRNADMISMMVSVYGSKEVFIKEYCQLLAERLLRNANHDLSSEERYIELLKLRFGENELHQCEVMLKDMKDSKRIDDFVAEQKPNRPLAGTVSVLSSQYWPSKELREEQLKIPDEVSGMLEEYRGEYELFKGSRTLDYRWQLGSVVVELELEGQKRTLTLNPFQASLLYHFQTKETWSVSELCKVLEAPQSAVKRRLTYWAMLGVLRETEGGEVWTLGGTLPPATNPLSPYQQRDSTDDDDDDMDVNSMDDNADEELEQYWLYIMNLLRLGPLKPERLHGLLKNMYSSPGKPSPSIAAINSFLQKKVREQFLIFVNGLYKLQPKQ